MSNKATSVKLVYGNDIRRVPLNNPVSLDALKSVATTMFGFPSAPVVHYFDDEKELVTISTQSELDEAVRIQRLIHADKKKKSLKFVVFFDDSDGNSSSTSESSDSDSFVEVDENEFEEARAALAAHASEASSEAKDSKASIDSSNADEPAIAIKPPKQEAAPISAVFSNLPEAMENLSLGASEDETNTPNDTQSSVQEAKMGVEEAPIRQACEKDSVMIEDVTTEEEDAEEQDMVDKVAVHQEEEEEEEPFSVPQTDAPCTDDEPPVARLLTRVVDDLAAMVQETSAKGDDFVPLSTVFARVIAANNAMAAHDDGLDECVFAQMLDENLTSSGAWAAVRVPVSALVSVLEHIEKLWATGCTTSVYTMYKDVIEALNETGTIPRIDLSVTGGSAPDDASSVPPDVSEGEIEGRTGGHMPYGSWGAYPHSQVPPHVPPHMHAHPHAHPHAPPHMHAHGTAFPPYFGQPMPMAPPHYVPFGATFSPYSHMHPHPPPYSEEHARSGRPTKAEASRENVHHGIVCDSCGVGPIRGARFKCTVCYDFDLCSVCEGAQLSLTAGANQHEPTHAMVKISVPVQHSNTFVAAADYSPFSSTMKELGRQAMGMFRGHSHGPHHTHSPSGEEHRGRWRRGCPFRRGGRGRGRRCRKKWRSNRSDNDWPGSARSSAPAMQFVSDVTIPDNSLCLPGVALTKVWKVVNSGDVAWPEGTSLVFTGGDVCPVGDCVIPVEPAAPGEHVNVRVRILVPDSVGQTAVGNFRLRHDEGQFFGQRIWVMIKVQDGSDEAEVLFSDDQLNLDDVDEEKESADADQEPSTTACDKRAHRHWRAHRYNSLKRKEKKKKEEESDERKQSTPTSDSSQSQQKSQKKEVVQLVSSLASELKRLRGNMKAIKKQAREQARDLKAKECRAFKEAKKEVRAAKKAAKKEIRAAKKAAKQESRTLQTTKAPDAEEVQMHQEQQNDLIREDLIREESVSENIVPSGTPEEKQPLLGGSDSAEVAEDIEASPEAQPSSWAAVFASGLVNASVSRVAPASPVAPVSPVAPPAPIAPAAPAFRYESELKELLSMGFNRDHDVLKYLLLQEKGNVGQAVEWLLQNKP